MASADFCNRIREPRDPRSLMARLQISPGITHPPSRLCASDIRHRVPYMYRASHPSACSPHGAASIRFLFVAPALCFRLPSDSQSPKTPLPSANTCPCRLCRGLSPPNECALPGAQKKAPLAGPSSASNYSATGDRQAAAASNCQFLGMITVSIA